MSDADRLSKTEREDYLIKLKKEFAFAGASIPELVSVDGERLRLRAFAFEIAKRKGAPDALPATELAEIDRVAALVRKERDAIVRKISAADLTKAEAEGLFRTARGLGRALDTLDRAREPPASVAEEARKAKLQDGRRWLGLVKKIYGKDRRRDDFQ